MPTSGPVLVWPLTGRDDELDVLLAALAADGAHAVVAGPAGVGKTRLVREAASRLTDAGRAVVRVVATETARAIPLGAFAPLLRGALPERADPLAVVLAAADAVLARAAGRPLVLVVDDAHQLDPTSATLVGHLAARGEVSIVATVRSGVPCPDVVVNLWKDGDAPRLELQALSAEEVGRLLAAALGGRVAAAAVSWAYRTSEGNPLYLRELVEGALVGGELACADGLWQVAGSPTPSGRLVDLVAARTTGLDPADQRAVELLALGEPLPLTTVETLVGSAVLSRLERHGWVRVDADTDADGPLSVRLGHPLQGEVVRNRVGRATGRALRRELAAALAACPSERGDDALRIATWRLDAGDPADPGLVRQAAVQAASALDHRLAARLAEAAHRAAGDLASAVVAASSYRALGEFDRAVDLLAGSEDTARDLVAAAADDRATGPVRGYLFGWVATLHWGLGRLDDACAVLHRAATWSTAPGWQHWVEGQVVTQLATGGRLRDAVTAARTLLGAADLDPATRLPAAVGAAYALHQTGRTVEAFEALDTAVASAGPTARSDWPPDALWALVAVEAGARRDEAIVRATALRDDALRRDDLGTAGWSETLLGRLALAAGDVDTALDRFAEAEDHLRRQDSRGLLPSCRALRVAALGTAGRTDPDVGSHRTAQRSGARSRSWLVQADLARADVWAAVAVGDQAEAVTTALAAAGRFEQAPLVRAELLHDAVRLGAPPRAVLADLRAAAAGCDAPLTAARLAHVDALARRSAAALDAAAERLAAAGAALAGAEAATAAAARHRSEGRPGAAISSQHRAADLLERCPGADTPALRAAAEEAGLTRREREVATLAARGHSNHEIADRLVLSVRTVESHVYRATVKLGVTRREDLAPLLRQGAVVRY